METRSEARMEDLFTVVRELALLDVSTMDTEYGRGAIEAALSVTASMSTADKEFVEAVLQWVNGQDADAQIARDRARRYERCIR